MLLPRVLKPGPPAPTGAGTWLVPLEGAVKQAQDRLALRLFHMLRGAWSGDLKEVQEQLRFFVR